MYIEKIKLRNFRNYQQIILDFQPGINVLLGNNAQGKTNLLESMFFLSTTRSHRVNDDKQMIRSNELFCNIECTLNDDGFSKRLAGVIHDSGKTLMISQNPVKKASEFIGLLNTVLFSPTDLELFESSPKTRRKFMDVEIGKISKTYMQNLSLYLKLLKERNNYLKSNKEDYTYLEVLNSQMIECQLILIKRRNELVEFFNKNITKYYQKLSHGQNILQIKYVSVVNCWDEDEKIRNDLESMYSKNQEKDRILQMTTSGIHRDDLLFVIDQKEVSSYASQGQRRLIILSLKLALIDFIKLKTNKYPVLLLDDVLSELDVEKRINLFQLLPDHIQTIITTTDINDLMNLISSSTLIYFVEQGTVSKWKEKS